MSDKPIPITVKTKPGHCTAATPKWVIQECIAQQDNMESIAVVIRTKNGQVATIWSHMEVKELLMLTRTLNYDTETAIFKNDDYEDHEED